MLTGSRGTTAGNKLNNSSSFEWESLTLFTYHNSNNIDTDHGYRPFYTSRCGRVSDL